MGTGCGLMSHLPPAPGLTETIMDIRVDFQLLKQSTDGAWRGFIPGSWQERVNVREFIQRNYAPYEGDAAFLAGPTQRTRDLWQDIGPLLLQEREKGVLDVSQVPSGILAHEPGYIDKDKEIIVGLQT